MPPIVIGAVAAAAVVGTGAAIAAASDKKTTAKSESTIELADKSLTHRTAEDGVANSYHDLRELSGQGPGASDVKNATSATRSLADMLEEYSKTSGLPTDADIGNANTLAGKLFAARRTSLDQDFLKQTTDAQRLSAQLGRPVDDPILQAKLRTGFMQQNDMLASEQQAGATDLALQMPGQRLKFAGQRADVLNSLSAQAFNNRAAILQAGSSLLNNERQYQLAISKKKQSSEQIQHGSTGQAIGAGMMAGGAAFGSVMSMGAGGGGGMGGGGGLSGIGGGLGNGGLDMNTSANLAASRAQPSAFGMDYSGIQAKPIHWYGG